MIKNIPDELIFSDIKKNYDYDYTYDSDDGHPVVSHETIVPSFTNVVEIFSDLIEHGVNDYENFFGPNGKYIKDSYEEIQRMKQLKATIESEYGEDKVKCILSDWNQTIEYGCALYVYILPKQNKAGGNMMKACEAYDKIKAYDKKVKENKKQKREKYMSEIEACEKKIKELEPRIRQLIEIGGMLIDSDNIDEKEFETEAIRHRVGFYKCTRYDNVYKYLGIRNGGANGNIDFITDGSTVKGLWFDSRNEYPGKPELYDYKKFLENFDEFEKKVFDFINNL